MYSCKKCGKDFDEIVKLRYTEFKKPDGVCQCASYCRECSYIHSRCYMCHKAVLCEICGWKLGCKCPLGLCRCRVCADCFIQSVHS